MQLSPEHHRSGFVSIIGKPNAGKSTLLNALLDRKLSIITPKAQTTRHRILGIDNSDDYQIVYSDTPGVIRPKYQLHQKMMRFVGAALEDADLIVLLIAADETFPEDILLDIASKTKIPKILAINKIDAVSQKVVKSRTEEISSKIEFVEKIEISALKGNNIPELKQLIINNLPLFPPYFDKESLSDRPERFFVSEMIREQIFLLLRDEIPYSCEVEIVEFQEEEKIIRINATIHAERRSQKGMIIGKGGRMLKKIGSASRQQIEEFLAKKVFLQLYVKVSEGWKDNEMKLRGFGY